MADEMDHLTSEILNTTRRRRNRSDSQTDVSLEALNEILRSNEAKTEAAVEARRAAEKEAQAYEILQQVQARQNDLLEQLLRQMEYHLEWNKELLGSMIAPNLEKQASAHAHILRALQYILQRFVATGDGEAKILNEDLRKVLEMLLKHASPTVSVGGTDMQFNSNRDQTIKGSTITGQHSPKE